MYHIIFSYQYKYILKLICRRTEILEKIPVDSPTWNSILESPIWRSNKGTASITQFGN